MGFDRQRLLGVLITLATALFLTAVAPGFRYRRAARRAAIAFYGLAVAGAVAWAALWLTGIDG